MLARPCSGILQQQQKDLKHTNILIRCDYTLIYYKTILYLL